MTATKKPEILPVSKKQAFEFWRIFVNRRAYLLQSKEPGGKANRHYYFKPVMKETKQHIPLDPGTILAHLSGRITVAVYAINPETQSCKWIAIDADYTSASDDLKLLREAFAADGIASYHEDSRRGGHLWIFLEEPIPAALCRLYVLNKANVLGVPVKILSTDDGIEVFPKQDLLQKGDYGNAIRLPCGIHRASGERYWFVGAEPNIQAQLALLLNVERVTRAHLDELTTDLKPVETEKPIATTKSFSNHSGAGKKVIVSLGSYRRSGKNYITACPVCDVGNSRRSYHLSVKIADPTVYRCWHNCPNEEIKRALGVDPRDRLEFAA